MRFKSLYFLSTLILLINACTKEHAVIGTASVNVVNASPGVLNAKIKTVTVDGNYSQLNGVNYGQNNVFTIPVIDPALTIVSGEDTTKILYNDNITSEPGNVYTLFLAGNNGEDIILDKDDFPVNIDSSFGLRFTNLSSGSPAITIKIAGVPAVEEFSNISYKAITSFKSYSAKKSDPANFIFEARDALTDSLYSTLAIRSVPSNKFRNITLAFVGQLGQTGTSAFKLIAINNF
jgi:hypothetical protein